MRRVLDWLVNIKSRYVADIIIGFLMSTSTIWVDVNIGHRILIGIAVIFASETLFRWIDERQEAEDEEENIIDMIEIYERKERNRDHLYNQWKKEMP